MTGTPVGTPVPAPSPGGSGGVPPPPPPPITPQQLQFQQAMLQQLGVQAQNPNQQGGGSVSLADAFKLIQVMSQSQSPAKQQPQPPPGPPPPTLTDPRCGGQNLRGVWVGLGKLLEGKKPKSASCYRDYKFKDRSKAINLVNNHEKDIKKGLSEEAYHFTMPLEATKNQTPLQDKLRQWESFAIDHGLEGSFYIKTHTGNTIYMFKEPGKLTEAIVKTWCDELANGVVSSRNLDESLVRLPPCEYDKTNNELSATALLASCSLRMKKEVQRYATGTLEVGPFVLWTIISNNEVSSSEAIRELCADLKKINIKEIKGENVHSLSVMALDKDEEIRARCHGREPDDITQLSLFGLTFCSDEGIRAEARRLISQADKPWSTLTPEEAMKEIVAAYNLAIARNLYGPHQAKPTSAMLGASRTSTSASGSYCQPTGSTLDPNSQAMVAVATALTATLQRTSDTYQGNQRKCYRCGQPGHDAKDCTATVNEMLSSGGNRSSGGNQSSGRSNRSNQRGLSEEESKKVNKLINDFQLPAFSQIKDTDLIEVKDENADVKGQYCKRCRPITKKGPSMHWTGTHQSKKKGGGSSDSSTTSSLTSGSDEAAIAEAVKEALQAMQLPQKEPDLPSVLQLRGTSYETQQKSNNMFLCRTLKVIMLENRTPDHDSC